MGGLVAFIAESLGGAPEAAIRMLLVIFAGYPLAFLYRSMFFKTDATKQHILFTVTGMLMMYCVFGIDVWHSALDIVVAYIICRFMAGSTISVVFAFAWFMGHLFLGYMQTESDEYDIKWTIPQCIISLRLIGLTWDIYDGCRFAKLNKDLQSTAVTDSPSILEIAAYSYFFGGFLVGPQFPLRKFRSFVNGEYADEKTGGVPNNLVVAFSRTGLGLVYLGLHQYFIPKFPNEYFLSPEFASEGFFTKFMYLLLWTKLTCFRYQAVWCLVEGVCILTTLGYGSKTKEGRVIWDGVRNIRISKFELGSTFQSVVESFNYNTNQWAARYVFKRLRFLGNKTVSHLVTLMFLAIWHGFHLGYFTCFAFEFLCIITERQAADLRDRFPQFASLEKRMPYRVFFWLFGKVAVLSGMTYGFLTFGLIKKEKWWPVLTEIYFCGWVLLCIVWPTIYNIASDKFNRLPKPTEDEEVVELDKDI